MFGRVESCAWVFGGDAENRQLQQAESLNQPLFWDVIQEGELDQPRLSTQWSFLQETGRRMLTVKHEDRYGAAYCLPIRAVVVAFLYAYRQHEAYGAEREPGDFVAQQLNLSQTCTRFVFLKTHEKLQQALSLSPRVDRCMIKFSKDSDEWLRNYESAKAWDPQSVVCLSIPRRGGPIESLALQHYEWKCIVSERFEQWEDITDQTRQAQQLARQAFEAADPSCPLRIDWLRKAYQILHKLPFEPENSALSGKIYDELARVSVHGELLRQLQLEHDFLHLPSDGSEVMRILYSRLAEEMSEVDTVMLVDGSVRTKAEIEALGNC